MENDNDQRLHDDEEPEINRPTIHENPIQFIGSFNTIATIDFLFQKY
jgi:hypothetical protein